MERNMKMGVPPTQFYLVMVQSIWIFQDTPTHLILIDFSSTPMPFFLEQPLGEIYISISRPNPYSYSFMLFSCISNRFRDGLVKLGINGPWFILSSMTQLHNEFAINRVWTFTQRNQCISVNGASKLNFPNLLVIY